MRATVNCDLYSTLALYVYRLGAPANQPVLELHIWKGFAGTQQWGESMTSYQDGYSEELTTMTLYNQPQYNCRVEDTKFIINLAEAAEFYKNTRLHNILIEPLFYYTEHEYYIPLCVQQNLSMTISPYRETRM